MRVCWAICLWLGLSQAALAAPSSCTAWPTDGLGADAKCLARSFKERGFSPAQAWRYTVLLERFASPLDMDPQLPPTQSSLVHLQRCRKFGLELRQHTLAQDPASLETWEDLARVELREYARQAVAAGQQSSLLVGCGVEGTALQTYLNTGAVDLPSDAMTWSRFKNHWGRFLPGPRDVPTQAQVRHLRATLGLQWLRISALQAGSAKAFRGVSDSLLQTQDRIAQLSGWSSPVLGLHGRVALDVSLDPGPQINGELLYSPDTLLVRSVPGHIRHEWLHALDYALSQTPGRLSSSAPSGPLQTLLQSLSEFSLEDQPDIVHAERWRLRQALSRPGQGKPTTMKLLDLESDRAVVEALLERGWPRRDAAFMGQVVWQRRPSLQSMSSWVDLRQSVAGHLVQAQSDGWLPTEAWGRGSVAYVGSPGEILASHFAGVLQDCPEKEVFFPLEMPTCAEAQQQSFLWTKFFGSLAPIDTSK